MYPAIFSHLQAYLGTTRDTEVYSGIIETYGTIIIHIRNSAQPLHIQPYHIQKPGLFTARGIFKSL